MQFTPFLRLSTLFFLLSNSALAQTTLLKNANVITMDPDLPKAQAIAFQGDRIVWMGSEAEAAHISFPDLQVIDVQGASVLPGLIESHGHLLWMGKAHLQLNLVDTKSQEEVVKRVEEQVKRLPPGTWITGFGWDHNDWPKKQFPHHQKLSEVSPAHPVFLKRIDGAHSAWANAKAMELAGIDRNTPDPEGGKILRDSEGEPTGIFIDRAGELIHGLIPPLSDETLSRGVELAVTDLLRNGITTFHDLTIEDRELRVLRSMRANQKFPIRYYGSLDGKQPELIQRYFAKGPLLDPFLTVRSIKLYADGALGSRGAALLEDYSDEPGNKGLVTETEDGIYQMALNSIQAGFQLRTHAIGDKGNRITLNAYERAFQKRKVKPEKVRFTIEHAQVIHPQDVPRFAKLGVIASMQATHCTSDMPWVHDRLGADRASREAYVWKSLLKAGARIIGGSDAPVESVNPFWGVFAFVTRQDHLFYPDQGWHAQERINRLEALRSYTSDAAYASFEEDFKGQLRVGLSADLIVVNGDPLEVEERRLLDLKVLRTFVAGREVYRAQ